MRTLGQRYRQLSAHARSDGGVLGLAVAAVASTVSGLAMTWMLPHGPATATQSLLAMAMGLAVGLACGLSVGSRWVFLAAPALYVAAVEIGRHATAGMTVGPVRLDSGYGVLALILGRGLNALLVVLPMLVGIALAHRAFQPPQNAAQRGWWGSALGLAVLAVWAVGVAWPASTPPITDDLGRQVPGSIAELAAVTIGDTTQHLLIRGHSADKPIMLYLSGGPGQSSLPFPRVIFQDMERDFLMVAWDQRGTGKSYAALDQSASPLTLDRAVQDTIEVTDYLRRRFGQDRIYLLGESYGTILSVLAAQQAPERYHAIIGSGQMVCPSETTLRLHHDVLALAESTGNEALKATMNAFGEPPYDDIMAGAFVMGYYEQLYQPYTPPRAYIERGTSARLGPWGILGSEYNLIEKVNVLRGLMDVYAILWPQLQALDLRRDAAQLAVPVYLLDGTAELASRRDLALEWFELLEAPAKRLFSLENAAHAVAFEQYEAFQRLMLEEVLPEVEALQ